MFWPIHWIGNSPNLFIKFSVVLPAFTCASFISSSLISIRWGNVSWLLFVELNVLVVSFSMKFQLEIYIYIDNLWKYSSHSFDWSESLALLNNHRKIMKLYYFEKFCRLYLCSFIKSHWAIFNILYFLELRISWHSFKILFCFDNWFWTSFFIFIVVILFLIASPNVSIFSNSLK